VQPVHVVLGTSRRLGVLLGCGHLCAGLLAAAVLPTAWTVPLAAALVASLVAVWRMHVTRSAAGAIVALGLAPQGITLHHRDGRAVGGRVVAGVVFPWLVLVSVRGDAGRRTAGVVVLPDATTASGHRQLRVWLKWSRPEVDNPARI
jgi:hypothetical protein